VTDLLALTKSATTIFGASWRSKKFALAATWTLACLAWPATVPPWTGAIVAGCYLFGQGLLEAAAAFSSGVVVEANGQETPDQRHPKSPGGAA
jgi:hypothetical protein